MITAVFAAVMLAEMMPSRPPYIDTATGDPVQIRLKPGEYASWPFRKNPALEQSDVDAVRAVVNQKMTGVPRAYLHVFGFVDYTDDCGTRRRIGFCRRYNAFLSRFEKSGESAIVDRPGDPDYEYGD